MVTFRPALRPVIGLLILALLVVTPAAAQDPPGDTIAVIKADESPSNAEVAVRLSEETPLPDVEAVVIGRDDEFADSLASGVLQADSPLLLVPREGPVPDRVRDELARLDPERVILLGGDNALRPAVAEELAGLGYAVERRAGDSRFETATAVARTDAAGADTVILARAFAAEGATDPTQAFADALAAGGMAAEFRWPVLLTQTEVLTGSTRQYLQEAGIRQVEIMGGTAAISAAVEAEINAMGIATERLAGNSRAETALAVADKRGDASAADAAHVVLVQGQTPDAWAGGFAAAAHAALLDAPIVLAAEDQLPQPTRDWLLDGATGGTAALAAGASFAVDPSDGSPVLTCVTIPALCEDARVALGLPPAGSVTFSPPPGSAVRSSEPVTATFAGPLEGLVSYGGTCLSQPGTTAVDGLRMLLGVDVDVPAGACTFTLTFTPQGGLQQTAEVTYTHSGEPAIALLSRAPAGPAGGGEAPSASADGSVVAFASDGPLLPGVAAGEWHAYVHDGAGLRMLDVRPDGSPAVDGGQLGAPDVFVSASGRHVAFTSDDDALEPRVDAGVQISTYVRDLMAGTTRHVSVDLEGTPVSRGEHPSLSADGTIVVYTGQGETGRQVSCACTWIWWRDLAGEAIGFVRTPDGQPVQASGTRPQLSADGRFIAFQTHDPLLPADDNDGADVYLYEITTATLELVSVGPDGTAGTPEDRNPNAETGISGDGRYVVFTYSGGDLVAGEDAGRGQIYLRDRLAGTTTRISQGGSGALGSAAGRPQIADDGSWVAFASDRALVPATQGGCGIYRYDVAGGLLDRVDLGGTTGGNTNCPLRMDVTGDGAVVFDSLGAFHVDDAHAGTDVYRAAPRRDG